MRDPTRPVILYSNGIGDTILALPALRALDHHFGGDATLLCERPLWEPLLSEVRFTPVWLDSEFRDGARTFDALSTVSRLPHDADWLISLVPWHSESVTLLLEELLPRHSVGFSPYFEHRLPLDPASHTGDTTFLAARFVDPSLRYEDFCAFPSLSETALSRAARILAPLPEWSRLLVVHVDTLPEKMWSTDRFRNVLEAFLEHYTEFFVFQLGWAGPELVLDRHGDRLFDCRKMSSLDVTLGLVKSADLFLGIDSSLLHAADFARVPSVGLFGPTDPREFGCRHCPHIHMYGNGQMEGISADEVLEALIELWESQSALDL